MSHLVDTTEMYLRTILDLEEEGIVPLRARISERLAHSGPTVSQTVGRMERDGLVEVEGNRHLALTDEGRRRALHVMRKHRLAERLLADVVGLDWAYLHDEACRWEHVISDKVEQRLIELLENPSESPYGSPIPDLNDDSDKVAKRFLTGVKSIADSTRKIVGETTGVVRRLAEPVQFEPELLGQLYEAGIVPGTKVRLQLSGSYVFVQADGRDDGLELPTEVAEHIYVEA